MTNDLAVQATFVLMMGNPACHKSLSSSDDSEKTSDDYRAVISSQMSNLSPLLSALCYSRLQSRSVPRASIIMARSRRQGRTLHPASPPLTALASPKKSAIRKHARSMHDCLRTRDDKSVSAIFRRVINPAGDFVESVCAKCSSLAPAPRSPAISTRRRGLPRRCFRRDRVSSGRSWRRHESRPA
jgi:hypothetical protein